MNNKSNQQNSDRELEYQIAVAEYVYQKRSEKPKCEVCNGNNTSWVNVMTQWYQCWDCRPNGICDE